MQNTSITKYHNLSCADRTTAETEFMSKVVPEWSSISAIFRAEYEAVGTLVDWSAVNQSHLPPVETQPIGTNISTRYLSGLQETFVMKPSVTDRTLDKYFTIYYFVVAHQYDTTRPKNYSGSIGFKVGYSLSELDQPNRSIELPIFVQSFSASAPTVTKWGTLKIVLTQDVVSLGFETSESSNAFDMWFSTTGDPVTNQRTRTIIGGTGANSSGNSYSMSGDAYGRVFDDEGLSSSAVSGSKGSRYNVVRVITPDSPSSFNCTARIFTGETAQGAVHKNLAGVETIIPGPLYVGDNYMHSNMFPGTPFFFTYKSEIAVGAKQVINGISYVAVPAYMHNSAGAAYKKMYQTMVRENQL